MNAPLKHKRTKSQNYNKQSTEGPNIYKRLIQDAERREQKLRMMSPQFATPSKGKQKYDHYEKAFEFT